VNAEECRVVLSRGFYFEKETLIVQADTQVELTYSQRKLRTAKQIFVIFDIGEAYKRQFPSKSGDTHSICDCRRGLDW
jgi:hypothetical protein